jgi:hypothetical protein
MTMAPANPSARRLATAWTPAWPTPTMTMVCDMTIRKKIAESAAKMSEQVQGINR